MYGLQQTTATHSYVQPVITQNYTILSNEYRYIRQMTGSITVYTIHPHWPGVQPHEEQVQFGLPHVFSVSTPEQSFHLQFSPQLHDEHLHVVFPQPAPPKDGLWLHVHDDPQEQLEQAQDVFSQDMVNMFLSLNSYGWWLNDKQWGFCFLSQIIIWHHMKDTFVSREQRHQCWLIRHRE